MYSGLLPKGLTEDDLSSDPEDESVDEKKELTGGLSGSVSRSGADDGSRLPGISTESWQKFQELRKKKDEMKAVKVHDRRTRKRRRGRSRKRGRRSEEPAETR